MRKIFTLKKLGKITLLATLLFLLTVSYTAYADIEPDPEETQPISVDDLILKWDTIEIPDLTPYIRPDFSILNIEKVDGTDYGEYIYVVLVESSLWEDPDIPSRLTRYESDVETTVYGVDIWIYNNGSPEEIREKIQWWYGTYYPNQGDNLVGVLLVGDIPAAWFEIDQSGQWPPHEEFPIDHYYMDLDGTWIDIDSDDIYDEHYGTAAPEIWVGRIKADNMQDPEDQLIENYFDKNHDYRTGALVLPQRALVYIDDDWAPGGDEKTAVSPAYPTSTVVDGPADTTNAPNYITNIKNGYNHVFLKCHGSPGRHTFLVDNGAGGLTWGERVSGYHATDNNYRAIDPPVWFYNLFVCSGARFVEEDYLAGWCIFTDTYGLAAVGSTKTGSMTNVPEFYTPLGVGLTLGAAYKSWFTNNAELSREWNYGMALIGDPTLRMTGTHTMKIVAEGVPPGSNIINYYDDGWHEAEIDSDEWSGYCDHGSILSIVETIPVGSFGTEQYSTTDTNTWGVAEPRTFTVDYYHQYLCTITTSGLSTETATVEYEQYGETKTMEIGGSTDFIEWCDQGSTLTIENPVDVNGGRYYTEDDTSWTVNSAFTASVTYTNQYEVTCTVTTAGVGHTDLDTVNHVTVGCTQLGSVKSIDLYDGYSLTAWMDAGTLYVFENPSAESTTSHRWHTPDSISYTVSETTTTSLTYYEQFSMKVISTGGLLDTTNFGSTSYTQYGTISYGSYHDGNPWIGWCDIGCTLSASQIVLVSPGIRYHTPGTVSWTVESSEEYTLPYHMEYKVTLKAEGLPDTQSTTITVGTANPSPSDTEAGVDTNNYGIALDSVNFFTWTNWVHSNTDLTALNLITASPNEKFVHVYWTKDGVRLPPVDIQADTEEIGYIAHYAGIKKEISVDEAELCDKLTVTLTISNPPTGTVDDTIIVVDDIPNEYSYVIGSAEIDDTPTEPAISVIPTPEPHQRLEFTVDGSGEHVITFDVKVNRAYAGDTVVVNQAGVTFEFEDVPPVDLVVTYDVTIHPYVGPTLSKVALGPTEVPVFTKQDWVFRYIVKNNYEEDMADPSLKDNFGAELVYDPDTIIANLYTDPVFTFANGKSQKVRLLWGLPDVDPGEAYALEVTMSTGMTPSKVPKQHYTRPGVKVLDSGSTLKWLFLGKKQSLKTDSIYVRAVK